MCFITRSRIDYGRLAEYAVNIDMGMIIDQMIPILCIKLARKQSGQAKHQLIILSANYFKLKFLFSPRAVVILQPEKVFVPSTAPASFTLF